MAVLLPRNCNASSSLLLQRIFRPILTNYVHDVRARVRRSVERLDVKIARSFSSIRQRVIDENGYYLQWFIWTTASSSVVSLVNL